MSVFIFTSQKKDNRDFLIIKLQVPNFCTKTTTILVLHFKIHQLSLYQKEVNVLLLTILLHRVITLVRLEQPIDEDYRKDEIDALPTIQMLEKDFFQSIKQVNFAKMKQIVSMKFIYCFLVISPH